MSPDTELSMVAWIGRVLTVNRLELLAEPGTGGEPMILATSPIGRRSAPGPSPLRMTVHQEANDLVRGLEALARRLEEAIDRGRLRAP